MRLRFWRRRRPSEGLQQAEEALTEIRKQRDEVDKLEHAMRRVRVNNGLIPLIERAIRNPR